MTKSCLARVEGEIPTCRRASVDLTLRSSGRETTCANPDVRLVRQRVAGERLFRDLRTVRSGVEQRHPERARELLAGVLAHRVPDPDGALPAGIDRLQEKALVQLAMLAAAKVRRGTGCDRPREGTRAGGTATRQVGDLRHDPRGGVVDHGATGRLVVRLVTQTGVHATRDVRAPVERS